MTTIAGEIFWDDYNGEWKVDVEGDVRITHDIPSHLPKARYAVRVVPMTLRVVEIAPSPIDPSLHALMAAPLSPQRLRAARRRSRHDRPRGRYVR